MRHIHLALAAAAALSSACARDTRANDASGRAKGAPPVAAVDSTLQTAATVAPVMLEPTHLSPLADSIAGRMTFAPANQSWFLAAARGKRMLVDIGRVDADLRKDSTRVAAYREAVAALSPVPRGAKLRLTGPWGTQWATVAGFDTWNGRIVATIDGAPAIDSLARRADPLIGAALRMADATQGAAQDTTTHDTTTRVACTRDSLLPPELTARMAMVRDSVEQDARQTEMPTIDRLMHQVKVQTTSVHGCFGAGRVVMVVSLRAGANEYVREHWMMLDQGGAVIPLKVKDFRFKAHDALGAFDADGDGVDDLAVRGITEAAGGLVILKMDPTAKQVERLTSGFAWEAR